MTASSITYLVIFGLFYAGFMWWILSDKEDDVSN